MDRGGQLGGAGGGYAHKRGRAKEVVKLGDVVQHVLTERISPLQSRFGAVAETWSQILPGELSEHCEIVTASGGQLKVRVDLPAYMYELQLCSSELLEEMQRQCPQARLKRIKFVLG